MDKFYQDNFEKIIDMFCVGSGGCVFLVKVNPELTLISANKSFYDFYEYTETEMLDKIKNKTAKLIYPEDYEGFYNHCLNAEKGTQINYEMRVCTATGTIKNIKFIGVISKLEGELILYGFSIDITNKIYSEQDFNEQMSYKNIVEQNIMGSFRLNLTKNICVGGQRFHPDVFNLQCDENLDAFFQKVYDDIPSVTQKIEYEKIFNKENMISNYKIGNHHLSYSHKFKIDEDRVEWVETHTNTMKNPITNDIESLIYTFNVNSEKITKQLIDNVVSLDYEIITIIDMKNDTYILNCYDNEKNPPKSEGCFTEMNRNYINDSVADEKYREICHKHINFDFIVKELKNKKKFSFNYGVIDDYGIPRMKQVTMSYVDREAQLLCLARSDITDIIREEQQKNELMKSAMLTAKDANNAKTDFLSRMSHEIRTPLNAIIGMATIAEDLVDNKREVLNCLSKINISSKFLLSLINDILDMTKVESGKIFLKLEEFKIVDLIHTLDTICKHGVNSKNLDYEIKVDKDVDLAYVGDLIKLQQVLINILSNSVKFTDNGGKITLSCSEVSRGDKDATLKFVIMDTGCGIHPEFIPYLFEPFEQEDNAYTSSYAGTGLGLAISKNFVNLMGGKIEVESELGKGSIFTVYVKVGIIYFEKLSEKIFENKSEVIFDELKDINLFKDKRILLVEDNLINIEVAKRLLEKKGFIVKFVQNGRDAVEEFRNKADDYYSAILMDIRMPIMDGLIATSLIRKLDKKTAMTIPIIAMTANAFEEDLEKSRRVGMNEHLAKPIEPKILYNTLKRLIK